jgi:DNA-binding NarL/FixJ family response regulator
MRCRLLIWSNQPAFVRAMRSLAHREDMDVVAIAGSADAVHRNVNAHHPDVILVDRRTEEQHPDDVVRLIGGGAHLKVVAMDLADEAVLVLEGRRAPATTVRELVSVIEGSLSYQAA